MHTIYIYSQCYGFSWAIFGNLERKVFICAFYDLCAAFHYSFIYNYCTALTLVGNVYGLWKVGKKGQKWQLYLFLKGIIQRNYGNKRRKRVHQSGLHLEDIKEDLLGLACLELIAWNGSTE